MNFDDVITLARAGFTAQQILSAYQATTATPAAAPATTPAAAPQPTTPAMTPAMTPVVIQQPAAPATTPDRDTVKAMINEMFGMQVQQNINTATYNQQPEKTVDQMFAEILNPQPPKKE